MTGPLLAIETATEDVEVVVCDAGGRPLAQHAEDVAHGHTRRLAAIVQATLGEAGVAPAEIRCVAADLGPGSFTGVRVGLATARALALVAGAECRGASSLAALAIAAGLERALVVPLVPAGRRDVYAGWYRADRNGHVAVLLAPEVGDAARVVTRTREAAAVVPRSNVRFVGPGVPMFRDALEGAFPGATGLGFREDGLSALDLVGAAASAAGPAAGLPARGGPLDPVYVRPAQAEERVRHRVAARTPIVLRPFTLADVPRVEAIERRVFSDPWPESFFSGEIQAAFAYARVAERAGELVGYSVAWLGVGSGHLGNLAVAPEARRLGVANALLDDLHAEADAHGIGAITLEVRVSNGAAQALYRRHGYRLAGLRRRYYRDTGEDALVMERRPSRSGD